MEDALNSPWWRFLAYVGLPILVGVILLIIEYRTRFFARQMLPFQDKDRQQPNPLAGEAVTPVAELESPSGDWIQVAEEIKQLIEQQLESEPHGPVRLWDIKPGSEEGTAELLFSFDGVAPYDSESPAGYDIRITVTSEGRIIHYKRELLWD